MATSPSKKPRIGVVLRIVGLIIVGPLGVLGIIVSTSGVVALATSAAVLAGLGGFAMAEEKLRERGTRRVLLDSLCFALGGVWTVYAGAGLALVLGPAAVPVALLAVVGVVWLCRRRSASPVQQGDQPPVVVGDDLTALPNDQLAREWRRSHARLAMVRSAAELDRVLVLRRRQLEEMERRDPTGFHRWLGSGSWILSDSAPFLGR